MKHCKILEYPVSHVNEVFCHQGDGFQIYLKQKRSYCGSIKKIQTETIAVVLYEDSLYLSIIPRRESKCSHTVSVLTTQGHVKVSRDTFTFVYNLKINRALLVYQICIPLVLWTSAYQ